MRRQKEDCKTCYMPHDCSCECRTCEEARKNMGPDYTPRSAAYAALAKMEKREIDDK